MNAKAETIRAWLLGERRTEFFLRKMSERYRWTLTEYRQAMELAVRLELIEWCAVTQTWGASRSWASRVAS